jgi:hypothetical protein
VKIDTANEGGKTMNKAIRVTTNDPENRHFRLGMIGQVDKVVTITPLIAKLFGAAQEDLKAEIRIVPNEKYAFEILEVQAEKGEHIRYTLETVAGEGHPRYLLKIRNTKTEKGRYFDTISLKTDSNVLPEITIRVFGKIS